MTSGVATALAMDGALVVAGCGGHRGMSDKLITCRLERQNEYGAAIMVRYYEEGKLGTEDQIIRQFNARTAGDLRFGRTFVDAKGHLIPYTKLTLNQVGPFNRWMYESSATDVTNVNVKITKHLASIDAPCGS